MKKCNLCHEILPKDNFTKASKSADGLNWRCKKCTRLINQEYINSEQGRKARQKWYMENKTRIVEINKQRRREYVLKYPHRVKARHLIGQAVRRGLAPAPSKDKYWYNRWEFHHPDYMRPYFGCWMLIKDHRKIDRGLLECPPCIDYEPQIRENLLKEWHLPEHPLVDAFMVVEKMREKGWELELTSTQGGPWIAYWIDCKDEGWEKCVRHFQTADTPSVAICLAALEVGKGEKS